jgi:predicted outer membrane repeat protein
MRSLLLVACVTAACAASTVHAQIFVKADAVGMNDGTSWAHAFTDLQDALASATAGDEIWVAAGTYKPTFGNDRNATFELRDSVNVYGGFAGTEVYFSQRDYVANETILSGDIGLRTVDADNSYHVVVGTNVVHASVLDGFTITGGMADGGGVGFGALDYGAGLLNGYNGRPTLHSLVFRDNHATGDGGGMFYVTNVGSDLANLTFESNTGALGGGLYATGADCRYAWFTGNTATEGGGCYMTGATTLEHAHFEGNSAQDGGGLAGSGTVQLSSFTSNSAQSGGAAYVDDEATFHGVDFIANTATATGGAIHAYGYPFGGGGASIHADSSYFHGNHAPQGGGVYVDGDSDPHDFTVCTFDSNTAQAGGGVWSEGDIVFESVVFSRNAADYNGGAMQTALGSYDLVNVLLFGNAAGDKGGGAYQYQCNTTWVNCTGGGNIADTGGAMFNDGTSPTVVNTVLWGDSATTSGPEVYNKVAVPASDPMVSYSDIDGCGGSGGSWDASVGTDGGGNLDNNPLFVDAMNGDLHLGMGSPAIDAGNDGAPLISSVDLGGDPRILGVAVDMGAYEYHVMTAVGDAVPYETAFRGAYPNPFNPEVTLAFELDRARRVSVKVYDVAGRLVRTLVDGRRAAGPHRVVWDGLDSSGRMGASGVYFVRVSSEGWSDSRKIVLLK